MNADHLGPLCQEEWILDAKQERRWNRLLQGQGIDPAEFTAYLSSNALADLFFGEPECRAQPEHHFPLTTISPALLWKDNVADVFSPPLPRVNNHLWVVLHRPVHSFLQVRSEEAVHLKAIINWILGLLDSHFQQSAVIAQWNTPQPGQLKRRFTIELIPSRAESKKKHNLWDKVDCNNYVLFRGLFPPAVAPPSQKEIEQDRLFWKKALASTSIPAFPMKAKSDPQQGWNRVQTHRAEGLKTILHCMARFVHSQHLPMERNHTSKPLHAPDLVHQREGCPFCQEQILSAQTAYETDWIRVLYNYNPATPGAHFLIIPKRHTSLTERLSEEEVKNMHVVAQKLVQILQEKEGRNDIKMYIQNTPAVGQTVPHTHLHVLLTPKPLRYLLFSLNYEQATPLTNEEMQVVLQDIRQRLLMYTETT